MPRSIQAVLVLGAIALAAFPLIPLTGGEFYQQMLSQMMILAIFAMSLDLLQGVSGLVSLGHAAYFGLAGYALAFLTPADTPISLWWALPVSALGAGLAALIIGFFVVRTHGIYFIMVTMAFAQMVFFLFFDNKALGGSDGVYVNFRPDASLFGSSRHRPGKQRRPSTTSRCCCWCWFMPSCADCCSRRLAVCSPASA
ncbi:branched-chain amino acid ABC transporter permease [Hydrogenophaga sp.]|uniref:branched-chain amino acid ABC transporter permease n=1 Tax=Hydrogenophaga sp. TaxID=1904254 RepID=UPI003D2C05C7